MEQTRRSSGIMPASSASTSGNPDLRQRLITKHADPRIRRNGFTEPPTDYDSTVLGKPLSERSPNEQMEAQRLENELKQSFSRDNRFAQFVRNGLVHVLWYFLTFCFRLCSRKELPSPGKTTGLRIITP